MALVTPFWFKQRQAKAEEAGPNLARVSGPNLREALVGIREVPGGWQPFVKQTADGPDLANTQTPIAKQYEAWEAAFELFRDTLIV